MPLTALTPESAKVGRAVPASRRAVLVALSILAFTLLLHPAHAQNATTTAAAATTRPGAESDATVWGALVYADGDTDVAASAIVEGVDDAAFAPVSARLAKVFPKKKKFTLLGQHTQEIFREYESWVVPSKELFLKIDSKGPAEKGGMQLHIQLWHDTKVVVKTDAILKADSPLFIRGPEWRGGHLIFVVMLTAQKA